MKDIDYWVIEQTLKLHPQQSRCADNQHNGSVAKRF